MLRVSINRAAFSRPKLVLVIALAALAFGLIGLFISSSERVTLVEPYTVQQAEDALAHLSAEIERGVKNNGDLEILLVDLQEWIARAPQPALGHRVMAQARLHRGEAELAYAAIVKCLDTASPNTLDAETYLIAGTIAQALDQLDEANQHYASAVATVQQQDPTDAKARLHLAQGLQKAGQLDAARQTLNDLLDNNAQAHSGYAQYASLEAAAGDLNSAIQQINRAIRLINDTSRTGDPETDDNLDAIRRTYTLQKATLYQNDGRIDLALDTILTLPATLRTHPDALDSLAQVYADLGQPQRSAKLYEDMLSLYPLDAEFLAAAAHWQLQADNPDRAAWFYAQLQRVDPQHPALP